MTTEITETKYIDIKCKLCGTVIDFDISDETTYLSKTEHQNFFGTQLFTYRVQHTVGNEQHINAVLVDQKGHFRGYIDAYKEVAYSDEEKLDPKNLENFIHLGEEIETITNNTLLTNFFIINSVGWFLEIVKLPTINTNAVLERVYEKIAESKQIYKEIPQPLKIVVADLNFYVWIEKATFFIISVKDTEVIDELSDLVLEIIDCIETSNRLPNKRTYKILVSILSEVGPSQISLGLVRRLLTDDLFYSKIKTKYPERLEVLIPKIVKRHAISEAILKELLLGKSSFIEMLEKDEIVVAYYKEIIETLDFINRRKLLT
ncbi:MAG: hypothetical protein GF308_06930 [Candidatus Heimdallarchaeota archaeon]|nr:hypothetical protein [Candidatus Heimdallarchaeota archaeon]